MIKKIEHTGTIKVRELKKEVTPVIIFEDEFGLISAFIEYDSKYILLMKTPNGDFVHNISISYPAYEALLSLDRPDRKRYEELKRNNYKDNKFCIRPAKTLNDMKDESNQQNNCVYSNYSEKINS